MQKIKREDLTTQRYANFQRLLRELSTFPFKLERVKSRVHYSFHYAKDGWVAIGSQTDLDAECYKIEAPYRELVICDRCNENISDNLVVINEHFVYHSECVGNPKAPVVSESNGEKKHGEKMLSLVKAMREGQE